MLFGVLIGRSAACAIAYLCGFGRRPGLALTAAATAKLFLFDLATLDGISRVATFIVVGLVLLGMGAGYARCLAQQCPR